MESNRQRVKLVKSKSRQRTNKNRAIVTSACSMTLVFPLTVNLSLTNKRQCCSNQVCSFKSCESMRHPSETTLSRHPFSIQSDATETKTLQTFRTCIYSQKQHTQIHDVPRQESQASLLWAYLLHRDFVTLQALLLHLPMLSIRGKCRQARAFGLPVLQVRQGGESSRVGASVQIPGSCYVGKRKIIWMVCRKGLRADHEDRCRARGGRRQTASVVRFRYFAQRRHCTLQNLSAWR